MQIGRGRETFSLLEPLLGSYEPESSTELTITYNSDGSETSGDLQILSNDPSHPNLVVPLLAGAEVIVDTGDSGDIFYPASNPSVIAVAATDLLDRVAVFSTRGEYVDVAAPGSMILSTGKDSTYKLDSGTSMATPLVSSILALLLSTGLSSNDALERLYNTAYDIEENGKDKLSGYGIADPYTALTSTQPRIKEVSNNFIDTKKFVSEPLINNSNFDFRSDIFDNSKKLSKLKSSLSITNLQGKKQISLSANNNFLAYRKIEIVSVGFNNTRSKRLLRTDDKGFAYIKNNGKTSFYEITYNGDLISLPISLKISNIVQK